MRKTLPYLSLLAVLCGCSDEPPSADMGSGPADVAQADMAFGPLIAHREWTAVDAGSDPFDDRPADVVCERGLGWEVEVLDADESLTIETNACNYLGLTQPALRPVADGERLAVQLWHFQLEGGGPAHAAVAIDGNVVWERTIEIPSESELIYEEFDVPGGAAAGAPVVFHLHNHGLNSYNLVAIRSPD